MSHANFCRVLPVATAAVMLLSACSSDEPEAEQTFPEPTEQLVVTLERPIELSDRTRIPQDDPNFLGAEVSVDAIVFTYRAAPKMRLEAGHVVVGTGGNNTYMRRITAVTEATDTRVAVQT